MTRLIYIALFLTPLIWPIAEESNIEETYASIRSWYRKNKDKPVSFYQPAAGKKNPEPEILQILLIRHGKPEINSNGWFGYKRARSYIEAYDTVGVHHFETSPVALGPDENPRLYSSTLNRAYDTACKIFSTDDVIYADSTFIEFEREIVPLPIILPIKGWTSLSRFFWILGIHSSAIPGFREEKSRAAYDAQLLEAAAVKHKKVILVAHGYLNKYIVSSLKKRDWDHSFNGGNDYLAVQVLTKIE